MYRDTITLFNFHKDTGLWYPSIFSRVDLGVNAATAKTKTGNTSADAVTLLLHCAKDKTFTTVEGTKKSYLAPKAYAVCKEPAAFITFCTECDFFYVGVWDGVEELRDENYEAGLYHAMNEKHDSVYMIQTVAFFDLLPHVEIGGR